jgi:beta-glucosidase
MLDGKEVSASAPPPGSEAAAPTRINGTTGLPEEVHQMRPGKFSFNFPDGAPHSIEVDFIRQTAEHGTGITLEFTPPPGSLLPEATEAAKKADLIIAMLGLAPTLEGEEMPVNLPGFVGGDRSDIALPAAQETLLEGLASTGKPMVVVLLNGSALAVNFAQEHANAILESWYPGEAGGRAIADTLTGANNPGGRLPLTFYRSLSDLPDFSDYSMKNRTYRYFTGNPLYRFGYGLSYSKFNYSNLKLSTSKLNAGDTLTADVEIRNAGKIAGDEVAELYILPPSDGNSGLSPKLRLEGFKRLKLAPGESRHVTFTLDPRQLSEVDAQGVRSVLPGSYRLAVGGSQPGDPLAPTPAETASFNIDGTVHLPN